ncbi:MAG TPA: Rieske 2Fe-2S domain-containing protein [Micromonosporaceae bacterium]|nr:Rieske 2Fe-2S domain-containing protein [Micromonosporaceae bacterium]
MQSGPRPHGDQGAPTGDEFDVDDPRLTRFDLVREGARRDGVEIVHYAPRFPVPGTRAEKRIERVIALLLVLTGLFALAFIVVFVLPFRYNALTSEGWWYTPLLGLTLGLSLAAFGFAIVVWAKKLLPEEVSIQDRHDGASARDERMITGATIVNMADETGITRRPLLKGALLVGLLPLGGAAAVTLGGLVNDPHPKDEEPYFETGFNPKFNGGKPVRLVREDYSPIRPADVSVGGQVTVFPGIPHGTTNEWADSPTLLFHLREADARTAEANAQRHALNGGMQWGNFVAHSKICTHAGCPASLYEQQTNRLLCPCHQSQFQVTDNARPVFGPAARSLPQLPLDVDEEGYFIAKSDYKVAIGPSFWERP